MRRVPHRSIALALSISLLAATTVSAGIVPPFSDVAGHPFEEHIEWMRQAGLTEGCGGGRYCPDDPVTRGQMASFLARALELPPTSVDAFSDDNGTTHEDAINRLAASGIRAAATATRYCPSARSSAGDGQLPGSGLDLPLATRDWFADDDHSSHQTNINRLAESRIASGCRLSEPSAPATGITRGQMAAFLHRALTSSGPPEACTLFPASNVWNKRVDGLAVRVELGDDDHDDRIGRGPASGLRGVSRLRDPDQRRRHIHPRSTVSFDYDDESDHVSYPIPPGPRIEGGGDRHILMWDVDACRLYELFAAERGRRTLVCRLAAQPGTSRRTRCGPMAGRAPMRPACRFSPGSCATRRLPRARSTTPFASRHRRRATRISTRHAITPGTATATWLPPMGLRVRLKADFDIDRFGPQAQVILTAMKEYGMILADNGSPWFFAARPTSAGTTTSSTT